MATDSKVLTRISLLAYTAVAVLMSVAVVCIFRAPTEQTMGDAQRILYVHVSVAWLGLLGCMVMAACGMAYLISRNLAWDHWSQSAGEVGWLCCSLTLITGSLWAHSAWGTWWTWDPRLIASFILWAMYSGCLIVRGSLDDLHQRARTGSVLAIVAALDVPLVVMATRWFRGMHPVAPEMVPSMRLVLLASVVSFTALFTTLFVIRRRQVCLEAAVDGLRQTDQVANADIGQNCHVLTT